MSRSVLHKPALVGDAFYLLLHDRVSGRPHLAPRITQLSMGAAIRCELFLAGLVAPTHRNRPPQLISRPLFKICLPADRRSNRPERTPRRSGLLLNAQNLQPPSPAWATGAIVTARPYRSDRATLPARTKVAAATLASGRTPYCPPPESRYSNPALFADHGTDGPSTGERITPLRASGDLFQPR